MNTKNIAKLQARIQRIKEKIQEIGEVRPGSLSKQYNVCGNPNCRCKDVKNPRKHGPYFQLSYTRKGKSKTEFIKKDNVGEVTRQLKDYQKLKQLLEEWIDVSIEIARLRREEDKSR